MVEFLSDFVIHCLSKDLNNRLIKTKEELPTADLLDQYKHLNEDQISRFIKKMLKIYKALRVLERNKLPETPFFSKSIEKLVRYFTMKLPDSCGVEGNLSEYMSSKFSYNGTNSDTESQNTDFGLSDVFTMSTSHGGPIICTTKDIDTPTTVNDITKENINNSDHLGDLSNLDSNSLNSNISQKIEVAEL